MWQSSLRSTGFFFFQAEDGIRDFHVTGVQTCALPICVLAQGGRVGALLPARVAQAEGQRGQDADLAVREARLEEAAAGRELRVVEQVRSEERRVGKEVSYGRGA